MKTRIERLTAIESEPLPVEATGLSSAIRVLEEGKTMRARAVSAATNVDASTEDVSEDVSQTSVAVSTGSTHAVPIRQSNRWATIAAAALAAAIVATGVTGWVGKAVGAARQDAGWAGVFRGRRCPAELRRYPLRARSPPAGQCNRVAIHTHRRSVIVRSRHEGALDAWASLGGSRAGASRANDFELQSALLCGQCWHQAREGGLLLSAGPSAGAPSRRAPSWF